MQDCIEIASRAIGYQMKAFVINGVGVVTDEMIEAYALNDEDRDYMERAKGTGAATIIGPKGLVIAGPLPPGEGILYAEVDLDAVLVPKVIQDFGGHYNRFDVFSLHVNVDAPHPLVHVRSRPPAGEIGGEAEPPLLADGGEDTSRAVLRRISQHED
jgi:aliphatic nitrilase